ncbi:MAG TPA: hypothetical protein VGM37_19870 [Armatimonadota bacterium]
MSDVSAIATTGLERLTTDVADAIMALDASGARYKAFQPGAGPFGEPQLVAEVARWLNSRAPYEGIVKTKRTPDMLVSGMWAIEFKIARPFGDNGREAENWSVNLLHPYEGNASVIGDCLKLVSLPLAERKAVIVVGYEHVPPKISLTDLVLSFEAVATSVKHLHLSSRVEAERRPLVHPVHQCLRVFAWEVLGHASRSLTGDESSYP